MNYGNQSFKPGQGYLGETESEEEEEEEEARRASTTDIFCVDYG